MSCVAVCKPRVVIASDVRVSSQGQRVSNIRVLVSVAPKSRGWRLGVTAVPPPLVNYTCGPRVKS